MGDTTNRGRDGGLALRGGPVAIEIDRAGNVVLAASVRDDS